MYAIMLTEINEYYVLFISLFLFCHIALAKTLSTMLNISAIVNTLALFPNSGEKYWVFCHQI